MVSSKSLKKNFFSVWSSEMAYVLGFFAADGSMVRTKRGGHFIEFTITDRMILEHIQVAIQSNHHIGCRIREEPHKTLYRLQIGSKEWFEDLSRLGFVQKKSAVMRLPDVPGHLFCDFVRGYFDGDGNIYFREHFIPARNKKRWIFSSRFTSGSLCFLKDLHTALSAVGLKGGWIASKNRGYELVFSHLDSLALYRLIYHTVPATSLYLPRKYQLFRKAIETLYPERL